MFYLITLSKEIEKNEKNGEQKNVKWTSKKSQYA